MCNKHILGPRDTKINKNEQKSVLLELKFLKSKSKLCNMIEGTNCYK